MPRAFDLAETYIHLDLPDATELPVTPDFWQTIDHRNELSRGYLVMVANMEETGSTWEKHPAGKEIVYLLSGAVDFVLDLPEGEQIVELRGQAGCVVPRDVWHRSIVVEPGDMLFVTPGEGTTHRPL